jgi:hypothetical protein
VSLEGSRVEYQEPNDTFSLEGIRMEETITIAKIHEEFVPKYDRWQGRLMPRIGSWFAHVYEIVLLWLKGNRPYWKHERTLGTCRQHARTEFGDWLWLTAEIIWMVTRIELPIVPNQTYKRVLIKMQQTRERDQSENTK